MSSFPYIALFSSTLVFRTLIALSASHWLIIWIALELNILSFIPLIIFSSNHQETEAAIKYFLAQALGSRLLLLSATITTKLTPILLFSLLIKAGIAPFHYWFPLVIRTRRWIICLLLTTWQKLIPLRLILFIFSAQFPSLITTVGTLRAIIGGLGGLNQTQIRPLLAYSSIGHIGWMLVARQTSSSVATIYFLIYILISIPLISTAWIRNSFSIKFSNQTILTSPHLIIMLLLLLSLGGIPPFLGFFPKWILLLKIKSIIVAILLITGSLINLFYYLNIVFSIFLQSNIATLPNSPSISPTISLLSTLAILPFPAITLIIT